MQYRRLVHHKLVEHVLMPRLASGVQDGRHSLPHFESVKTSGSTQIEEINEATMIVWGVVSLLVLKPGKRKVPRKIASYFQNTLML
jgi:hypothetical protein